MVGCGENVINAKLLKYLVLEMSFEFHAIISQYVSRTHVDMKVMVDECGHYGVC